MAAITDAGVIMLSKNLIKTTGLDCTTTAVREKPRKPNNLYIINEYTANLNKSACSIK